MVDYIALLLASLLVLLSTHWLRKRAGGSSSLPFPPGPKPMPLVGNWFDIPKSHDWLKVAEWGKTYGDLIHVDVFGTSMIYINSLTIAHDLFEKRSSVYSSRAQSTMLTEMYVVNLLLFTAVK